MRIVGLGGACVRKVLQHIETQATTPCRDMLTLNTNGKSSAGELLPHHHILLDPSVYCMCDAGLIDCRGHPTSGQIAASDCDHMAALCLLLQYDREDCETRQRAVHLKGWAVQDVAPAL